MKLNGWKLAKISAMLLCVVIVIAGIAILFETTVALIWRIIIGTIVILIGPVLFGLLLELDTDI